MHDYDHIYIVMVASDMQLNVQQMQLLCMYMFMETACVLLLRPLFMCAHLQKLQLYRGLPIVCAVFDVTSVPVINVL